MFIRTIWQDAYTKHLIIDLIEHKKSFCLKLTKNSQLIGVLGARSEGQNSFWLYFIVIKKQFQGKGYAKALMQAFFKESKKRAVKRIALDTLDKIFLPSLVLRKVWF